jgi:2-polyprenyl-6-methoxyphenol hydroxylase-like FAD-dependent oxidoreductase
MSQLVSMKKYDVVIAGASFAGLAVANQLKDYRVLLVDRKPVGRGQTSACGTILQVLEYWDVQDAVLQKHDKILLHTARPCSSAKSAGVSCSASWRVN